MIALRTAGFFVEGDAVDVAANGKSTAEVPLMRIAHLSIKNFRGIAKAQLLLPKHAVLIGDNNSGKSSVIEAIDLVLGPDRINRPSAIDEHDFYAGRYLDAEGNPIPIEVEITIVDLSAEQARHFKGSLEFWDDATGVLLAGPPIGAIEQPSVKEALRVGFRGWYEADDDDFKAQTFFCSPPQDSGEQPSFRTVDKRLCGFLLLRALRTGSRALSLERGSLLDIILRVHDLRPKMWEKVLGQLRDVPVADDPELGVTQILSGVQSAIRAFVPSEWAAEPHLRVSDLTRENLRRTLTVFMATGALNGVVPHAAPFQHQGNGTINMLVLSLLSMIADAKETVIFAMEEPEIAIPPATQKRIVDGVRSKSSQALFTSHSPYVLEEFSPSEILVLQRSKDGDLSGKPITFPAHIKPKAYSSEFRMRFAEALLARRVLVAEGETELSAYSAAARRLAELDPSQFASLEALGIAVFNARTDSQVAGYGAFFRDLGKTVFAVYDKQVDAAQSAQIKAAVDYPFEAPAKGFEVLVLDETAEAALRRFGAMLVRDGEWPRHLAAQTPQSATPLTDLKDALHKYLGWSKGSGGAADLLGLCTLTEMPAAVKGVLAAIKTAMQPQPGADPPRDDTCLQHCRIRSWLSSNCASNARSYWRPLATFSCWVVLAQEKRLSRS
jgi:putative ATP-dependent endonuclease of the OLD family